MVLTLLREAKVRTWDRLTKTLMQLNLRAAITVGHNHKCLGKTQIYEVAYSCGNKKIKYYDIKVANTMKSYQTSSSTSVHVLQLDLVQFSS